MIISCPPGPPYFRGTDHHRVPWFLSIFVDERKLGRKEEMVRSASASGWLSVLFVPLDGGKFIYLDCVAFFSVSYHMGTIMLVLSSGAATVTVHICSQSGLLPLYN